MPDAVDAIDAVQYLSLRVDHSGSHRCALGYLYFSIWSLSISLHFDEVAIHHLNQQIGGTGSRALRLWAGSGDAGMSRQTQTPPSISSFFKKFRYKVALDANICSSVVV